MKGPIDFSHFSSPEAGGSQLKSRSVLGAAALAFGAGGEMFLRLVSIVVLARLIAPAEFGLVGMVTALTAVAATFGQLGLATATVQRREISHGQVSNLFWIGLGLGALLAVVFCGLAVPIAAFYGEPRLVLLTLALASTFLIASCSVQHEALLTRTMQQPRTAGVRFAATLISAVVAVVLAVAGLGVWALVCQELSRSVAVSIGMWMLCRWRPAAPNRNESVRGFIRFGAELTLTQLLYAIGSNVDKLLVGRLFGASVLGLYRQVQQLVLVPIEQLNAPIASVAQPGLSLLQDDAGRYRRYYRRIVAIIGITTMPVTAFAMVFAQELTVLILGPSWAEAAPFFFIFAAAAFLRPVLGTSSAVLISRGRSFRLLTMTLVSQVIYLLMLGAGAFAGAKGIAMAHLVAPAVLFLPTLWFAFGGSPVRMRDFFAPLGRPLLASGVMVGVLVFYRATFPFDGDLVMLGGASALACLTYVGCFMVLPGGRTEGRNLARDVLDSVRQHRGATSRGAQTDQV